jgi:all-trans-8'-apo-beta-carotenal 15,15'-oxygenase
MTVASPAAAASPAYDRADWASSFRNVSVELSDEPLVAAVGPFRPS